MPLPMTRRSIIAIAVRACAAVSLGLVTGGFTPARARSSRHRAACRRLAATAARTPTRVPESTRRTWLAPEPVREHPDAVAAFDEARTIPEILDGIRCQCGCADEPGMRSLLSCYEGEDAMALDCDICEGQARLAYRLHGKGRSLDEIRAAIDARYGS